MTGEELLPTAHRSVGFKKKIPLNNVLKTQPVFIVSQKMVCINQKKSPHYCGEGGGEQAQQDDNFQGYLIAQPKTPTALGGPLSYPTAFLGRCAGTFLQTPHLPL